MTLDIAIIVLGILVFVGPPVWSRWHTGRAAAEERRLLDRERQRLARERRRLAAERECAAAGSAQRPGCPWCGLPIPPAP